MGGCATSRLGGSGEEDDPVALCRERKRLLKVAVERRYALAAAHAAYVRSLNAVASAIDLFVVRHSAPTAILVTLPDADVDPSPPSSSSAFLPHTPREANAESLECPGSLPLSPSSDSSSDDDVEGVEATGVAEEQEDGRGGEMGFGYFFSAPAPLPPSPSPEVFGWDFFNPFDGMQTTVEAVAMVGSLDRSSDEDLRLVREEEGIPELEEVEDRKTTEESEKVVALGAEDKGHCDGRVQVEVAGSSSGGGEEKGLAVAEMQGSGRELLQALRDVEDHFIRAHDSGKEVSRMLEANMVLLQSGLEEIKENSSKMIQAITWHRSPSSLSSSYWSHLASSSSSTTWSESKSDLFDDYGGMESGSHSQTLGRLYAWEKKLYEEVKAGDQIRQAYEKKCLQLRNQNAKGVESRSVDKTRAAVRDLYSRIWVALRAVESIAERIQKLRDEELQPQIIELLQGLMGSWKVMLESHEAQKQIMFEVNLFTCPSYGKYSNDSQRLATLTLVAELHHWRRYFRGYISAQKAYVEALDGWLSKFILPDMEFYSRTRSSLSHIASGPPLVVICHQWSTSLGKLRDSAVSYSMRSFARTVRFLSVKQVEEQQQKKKVDALTKELERRVLAFQKAEDKVLDLKLSENEPEHLAGKKEMLDMLRKKLEMEKEKHRNCMRATQEVTLNGFKIGLASAFESLAEFAKDSLKLYDELLSRNEKAKAAIETTGKPSFTEGSSSELEVNSR
ncbi:protein ALTERED PHOSPHATE STARVATION RESPONSE 1-like [Musa acuminata AAA Group]|uniref:protein ALTERED PHOSPHATE STARVATION RESPONSE 1-like n=1 Tax=Musa acuminata AAA Group TaxID=214697 RepID=UPI0031D08CF3